MPVSSRALTLSGVRLATVRRRSALWAMRRGVLGAEGLGFLAARGWDVASLPFEALDQYITRGQTAHLDHLAQFAALLPGEQPRLFRAILDAHAGCSPNPLRRLVADRSLPLRTRFEAMGWSLWVQHGGRPTHATTAPPPRIVQYWDTPDPPPEVRAAVLQWVDLGWRHTLFDNRAACSFIRRAFGPSEAMLFDQLWHPALRSDLFRLFFLVAEGGTYIDADTVPARHAREGLTCPGGVLAAISNTRRPKCAVTNGILSAPPEDPTVKAFLARVLDTLRQRPGLGIFWLGGPGALTSFLYDTGAPVALRSAGIARLTLGRQINAPYKKTGRNWRIFEKRQGLTDDAGLALACNGSI